MQKDMGLQEAYDSLILRIRTIEEIIIGQKAREDILINFLSFHILNGEKPERLKKLWNDFTEAGFAEKLIEEMKSKNEQMGAALFTTYEFNVKESIKQWDGFVDLAVDVRKKDSEDSE